jgi:MFS family permease
VYSVGLGLFTAASAACAMAPSASVLVAFRAVQGLGAAIVLPLRLTLLTSAFPVEKRGAVVGIWGVDRYAADRRTHLGRSLRQDRPRRLVVPGLLMQAVGVGWIVALASTSSGYESYVLPFVIAGTGISMALPCVTAAGLNAAPPEHLGKAAGTLNTIQQFGAVFGIAVVTAVFNSHGGLESAAAVTSGYRPALAAAATFSALGALTGVGIGRAGRATDRPRPAGPAGEGNASPPAGAGAGARLSPGQRTCLALTERHSS